MKSLLTKIFLGLGVIFFILILVGTYLFITDPYNLKPLLLGSPAKTQTTKTDTTETKTSGTTTTTGATTGGFQLSAAQKQALVAFGIDPATVPSSISAAQETCFVNVLGESRVSEIKAGAVPSALEFFKAKSCI